eukprot:12101981-Alexandrium_andersonii.AAC.1
MMRTAHDEQQRDRLQKWLSLWSGKHRRIGLAAICDSSGDVLTDTEQCAQRLAEYWGRQFGE